METPPGRLRLLATLCKEPLASEDPTKGRARKFFESLAGGVLWAKWELAGASGSKVPLYNSRFELLSHSVKVAPPNGLKMEFGVYRGESLNYLASLDKGPWFGFDSFEGLPTSWTPHLQRGSFSTSGTLPDVANNVTLVKGLFSDTVVSFLASVGDARVSFAHIDCDLYGSTKLILLALDKRLSPGAVIVFDEFTWLLPDDEARALREWQSETGHRVWFIGCSRAGSVAVKLED